MREQKLEYKEEEILEYGKAKDKKKSNHSKIYEVDYTSLFYERN